MDAKLGRERTALSGPDLSITPLTTSDLPTAPLMGGSTRVAFNVAVHDQLPDVEAIWRKLEANGLLTVYQRYDWIAGLLEAGAEPSGRVAIAVIRQGDEPVALLPLLIGRRIGLVQARMLGMRQSNSDWILSVRDFQPSPEELRGIFGEIAKATGGVDTILFTGLPSHCRGVPNPVLGLPHAPAPSNLYGTSIAGATIPYVADRLSTKRRTNINRSRRRLEELLGPVRLVRVDDMALLERVHAVFLQQRGARFDEMGLDNIFAQKPFPQFFRELTAASFGSKRPAMCAHALFVGDEIVATSWGATAGNHYSQYINSTTSGPAGRYSLMAVLIADLMDELLEWGIESFDLGLGDFAYKVEWTEPQSVFDSVIPLTTKGRIAAGVIQQGNALKRLVKQTPALWNAAKWARHQLHRLRRG